MGHLDRVGSVGGLFIGGRRERVDEVANLGQAKGRTGYLQELLYSKGTNLSRRLIVVTGAGSGIGRACAMAATGLVAGVSTRRGGGGHTATEPAYRCGAQTRSICPGSVG